jgi:hypothetical protein
MKHLLILIIFFFLASTSFSQKTNFSVGAFTNTGFLLNNGSQYSAGLGGGLQLGFDDKTGWWMLEASVTSFVDKNSDYGTSRINLIAIGPGYKLYAGKLMYGLISGGVLVDKRSDNAKGIGYYFGTGIGARPQLGRGNLDIFGRINFKGASTGTPNYIMLGIGYTYPFATNKK